MATRATRKDKKKEIKATLPTELREQLETSARRANVSPMREAARACVDALSQEDVIRALAPWFKRGYVPRFNREQAFMGGSRQPSLEPLLPEGAETTRFPIKLTQEDHEAVHELSYALDASLSQTVTILLSEVLRRG